jgi:hypothetical protein
MKIAFQDALKSVLLTFNLESTMKAWIGPLAAVLFVTSFLPAGAQAVKQAKVSYTVVDAGGDMPSSLMLYISQAKTRWEWTTGDLTKATLIDPSVSKGINTITEKGQLFANTLSEQELEFYTAGSVVETKATGEKSNVAGLAAEKFIYVVVDAASGERREMETWMSVASASAVPSIGGIPGKSGLPLEFDFPYNSRLLHLKAVEVTQAAQDPNLFKFPSASTPPRKELEHFENPKTIQEMK